MKYEWESVPNPDIQILHTDRRFGSAFDVGRPTPHWYGVWTDDDKQLLEAVAMLPGIVEISASTYRLHIEKGRVFSWATIRLQILAILERADPPDTRAPRHIRLQAQENP